MSGYTTNKLLNTIKQRGMVPSNQSTWENSSILTLATEIMRLDLMGTIVSMHEDYFVTKKLYDIANEDNSPRFRIPPRATAMALKGVYLENSAGDRFPVPRMNRELADTAYGSYRQTRYFIEWNDVVLQRGGGIENRQLRLDYYIEPGELVDVSRAARVTSIDGLVLTVDSVPSVFTDTSLYDLISHQGGREYYDIDLAVSNIDTITNEITFAETLPTGIQVGDYIALAGESPTPQLPNSLQPVLAQMCIVDVQNSLGFEKQAEVSANRAREMLVNALKTITPRVDDSVKKIVSGFSKRLRLD